MSTVPGVWQPKQNRRMPAFCVQAVLVNDEPIHLRVRADVRGCFHDVPVAKTNLPIGGSLGQHVCLFTSTQWRAQILTTTGLDLNIA